MPMETIKIEMETEVVMASILSNILMEFIMAITQSWPVHSQQ